MHLLHGAAILLALAACFAEITHGTPDRQFGYLTASLGTESFAGSFGPDSTVAIYDPEMGQLQIEGDRRTGSSNDVVRIVMICDAALEPGTYRIAAPFFTPVSAGVYRTRIRRWLPRRWARTFQFFITDSVPSGILELDTLDLKSGAISGRFRVGVRTVNEQPANSLFIAGGFTGRVRTSSIARTRPTKFSPQMGRDCNAAKLE
jgi:hypothetical protein